MSIFDVDDVPGLDPNPFLTWINLKTEDPYRIVCLFGLFCEASKAFVPKSGYHFVVTIALSFEGGLWFVNCCCSLFIVVYLCFSSHHFPFYFNIHNKLINQQKIYARFMWFYDEYLTVLLFVIRHASSGQLIYQLIIIYFNSVNPIAIIHIFLFLFFIFYHISLCEIRCWIFILLFLVFLVCVCVCIRRCVL